MRQSGHFVFLPSQIGFSPLFFFQPEVVAFIHMCKGNNSDTHALRAKATIKTHVHCALIKCVRVYLGRPNYVCMWVGRHANDRKD